MNGDDRKKKIALEVIQKLMNSEGLTMPQIIHGVLHECFPETEPRKTKMQRDALERDENRGRILSVLPLPDGMPRHVSGVHERLGAHDNHLVTQDLGDLRALGLVEMPKRGSYRLTPKGVEARSKFSETWV
jgi:hypothetical protein